MCECNSRIEVKTKLFVVIVCGSCFVLCSTVMTSSDNTGDLTWGYLEDTEIYGRKTNASDFIQVSRDTLSSDYEINHEASHCLLYAKNDSKIFGIYHPRATVLMQIRFDGYLGFPGGIIDEGEDAVFSLNRELKEEMHLDSTKFSVKPSDYVISHLNKKIGLRLHFYALEVTMDQLKKIEFNALQAKDYGTEVLGTIRVPLYTMGDGYRGLPVFLNHQFVGNSKEQLLHTVKHLKLLTDEEVSRALLSSSK